MELLIVLNFSFMAGYIALCTRLIKPMNKSWDVLELRLNLAPWYFKFVGIVLIFAAIAIYVWYSKEKGIDRAEELIVYDLNLGFLLLVFSREKHEDELFNQIRLKAIVASLIAVFIMYGMLMPSVFIIEERYHEWIFSFGGIMIFFYLAYLIYFYTTKFKMRK